VSYAASADDARKLLKDYAIKASNLVELSTFAIAADVSYAALKPRKLTSLAKLVERYTGKVLDKDKLVQCSDWEKELTESQQACTYPSSAPLGSDPSA
jgi:ribonuclease D